MHRAHLGLAAAVVALAGAMPAESLPRSMGAAPTLAMPYGGGHSRGGNHGNRRYGNTPKWKRKHLKKLKQQNRRK